MSHCRGCGAPLPAGRPVTCAVCGVRDWGNAKPCAASLVVRGSAVLLTRRAQAPWQGLWCAPAGFCDGPEHPILTAEREVLEETGLGVRVVGHLGTWISAYADDPDEATEHVSVQYFAAEPLDPDADAKPEPTEVAEIAWFPLDALPHDLAPADALPRALAALRDALTGPGVGTPLPDRP